MASCSAHSGDFYMASCFLGESRVFTRKKKEKKTHKGREWVVGLYVDWAT